MAKDKYDPDELFSLEGDPEAAIKEILDGAGATDEDSEMELQEPETEE